MLFVSLSSPSAQQYCPAAPEPTDNRSGGSTLVTIAYYFSLVVVKHTTYAFRICIVGEGENLIFFLKKNIASNNANNER
jgi:hypothetical protein